MDYRYIYMCCGILLALSRICAQDTSATQQKIGNPYFDSILAHIPKDIVATIGARFKITGDFNGDTKDEVLSEHYFNIQTQSEAFKNYENSTDFDQLVALALSQHPISFITASDNSIDTLYIPAGNEHFGLAFLHNEGDLTGDGHDELAYVIEYTSETQLNTYYIVTYKNNKWESLFTFPIWNWQLPKLDETINDSNRLVQKLKNNKFKIIQRKNEQLDTAIITLPIKHNTHQQ